MFKRVSKPLWRSLNGIRTYSEAKTRINSFFDLFPKTFPYHGPPNEPFVLSEKSLRREYRALQSEHHPDIVLGSATLSDNRSGDSGGATGTDGFSALLNRAYSTLKNPYTRIAHLIRLHHPEQLDITQDEVSKQILAKFQSSSDESSRAYKDMLMTVLEAHEALEFAGLERDIEGIAEENEEQIRVSEKIIDELLGTNPIDWDKVVTQAIKLKYWMNIENAIKDWEPGKPVNLTH